MHDKVAFALQQGSLRYKKKKKNENLLGTIIRL